jgi:hypothetical protein
VGFYCPTLCREFHSNCIKTLLPSAKSPLKVTLRIIFGSKPLTSNQDLHGLPRATNSEHPLSSQVISFQIIIGNTNRIAN